MEKMSAPNAFWPATDGTWKTEYFVSQRAGTAPADTPEARPRPMPRICSAVSITVCVPVKFTNSTFFAPLFSSSVSTPSWADARASEQSGSASASSSFFIAESSPTVVPSSIVSPARDARRG